MRRPVDPEAAAAAILQEAEIFQPPVDPSQVAALWRGLRVSRVKLDGAGYLLRVGDRIGEILVRADDSPARQTYTCAHELGHWVLHLRRNDPWYQVPERSVERWCDRFAAALLMPRAWVEADLRRANLSVARLATLHARFGISRHAMWLRASEVAPIDVAVIGASETNLRVVWSSARDPVSRLDLIGLRSIGHRLRDSREAQNQWESAGYAIEAARLARDRWLIAIHLDAALRSWEHKDFAPASEVVSRHLGSEHSQNCPSCGALPRIGTLG